MRKQQGVTFLWALLLLFILTLGLGRLLEVQSTQTQRQQEDELLWAGEQYRQAIERYYQASPGEVKQLPSKLEDLLQDPRLLTLTRHLREAYADPLTGQPFAEIRNHSGALIGVHSTSGRRPHKTAGFEARFAHFAQAESYSDWTFVFLP
jgi:type II secretory pathway pseudopilin PulG